MISLNHINHIIYYCGVTNLKLGEFILQRRIITTTLGARSRIPLKKFHKIQYFSLSMYVHILYVD